MHIISEARVHEYCKKYPDAADSLRSFLSVARRAHWQRLQEVRITYSHADAIIVGSGRVATAINVKGNQYRLIVAIHYNTQRIFVLRLLRHDEYSRKHWKKQL